MEDLIYLVKTAGPKMVPFIKTVTIYFVLVTFDSKGEFWTTILKCAPIVCLMIFIMLSGFKFSKEHSYSQRILMGLIFSCVGDALLNINLFPHGMGAFGIAQAFYISAFGFKPLKLWIGLLLYIFGVLFISVIYHSLDSILVYGLPVYSFLLITMAWRAIARANTVDLCNNSYKLSLTNTICAMGSVLFVISDGCIAIDRFYTTIPNARIYIMTTYYAAQFAITLSIVTQRKPESISISSKVGASEKIGGTKRYEKIE